MPAEGIGEMAEPSSQTIVVVTGGDPLDASVLGLVPGGALVVAADSGVDHALALGLTIHTAVGDFDSVTPAGLAATEAAGAIVHRHPAAKDATDLELALDTALGLGAGRIVVLGGGGGRLDHLLANLLLLASPRWAGVDLVAQSGAARVTVIRHQAVLEGQPDDVVTLLPAHGSAVGVSTEGLRFPLHGEDLPAGTSRGVSNELIGTTATVRLRDGVLLAVQPTPVP
jgi:thiamine pyrophosphokinase